MFFGYASALAELARVIAGRLYHDKDKFVAVSTSEVLTPYYRTIIEQHLCRKVYDQYGSQEGCHLAVECDAGYMHVHPHIGIVEVLNEYDKPCLNGELGRVVVTGFKHSMPLIRYDIGDSAIALDGPCPCGLVWPIIGPVAGRSEDLVITPDGRKIGYLNFHSTKNLKGIVESQLIQRGYTSFAFNLVLQPELVSNNEYTSFNESLIIEELQKRLGYHVQVEFAYLKDIPREGGRSKFKAVVVDFVADNN
jgi:phenylacetate-CoA ligase